MDLAEQIQRAIDGGYEVKFYCDPASELYHVKCVHYGDFRSPDKVRSMQQVISVKEITRTRLSLDYLLAESVANNIRALEV